MAITSIGEMVERARKFEEKLGEYYAQIRDESQDNGVRLLCYYLSRHRKHLDQVIEKFDPAEIRKIFNVRLKFDVDFDPEKNFKLIETPVNELRGNDLLKAAVDYDKELIKLYNRIYDQDIGEEARQFIEGLIKLEEKDVVMLKKMIAMNYF